MKRLTVRSFILGLLFTSLFAIGCDSGFVANSTQGGSPLPASGPQAVVETNVELPRFALRDDIRLGTGRMALPSCDVEAQVDLLRTDVMVRCVGKSGTASCFIFEEARLPPEAASLGLGEDFKNNQGTTSCEKIKRGN
jgi:hypothetical protein